MKKDELLKLSKNVIEDYALIYCSKSDAEDTIKKAKKIWSNEKHQLLKAKPISTYLLLDPKIKDKYDQIQDYDTTSYYHGYQHILNVLKNMNNIIDALKIEDYVYIDVLLTSVILHDIGRGAIGKGHEEKSLNYTKEYFDNNKDMYLIFEALKYSGIDIDEIKKIILNCIKKHEYDGDINEIASNNNSAELLVNLVDKLDITKDRVNLNNSLDQNSPSYKFDLFRTVYLNVENVNFKFKNKKLIININGKENLSSNELFGIPFMQKSARLLSAYALQQGIESDIIVNGESYNYDNKISVK